MRFRTCCSMALGMGLALFALPAAANVGLPTIFLTLPAMLIALVPVTAIEAWVLVKRLAISASEAGWISFLANLASTIVGVPVTWLLLLIAGTIARCALQPDLQKLRGRFLTAVLEAPWFPPRNGRDTRWMIPAGCLVLMLPYFIASCAIEDTITYAMLAGHAEDMVRGAVIQGNAVTYGLLSVMLLYVVAWEFLRSERPFRYQQVHAVVRRLCEQLSPTREKQPGYFWLTLAALALLDRLPGVLGGRLLNWFRPIFTLRKASRPPDTHAEDSNPALTEDKPLGQSKQKPSNESKPAPAQQPRKKAPDRQAA